MTKKKWVGKDRLDPRTTVTGEETTLWSSACVEGGTQESWLEGELRPLLSLVRVAVSWGQNCSLATLEGQPPLPQSSNQQKIAQKRKVLIGRNSVMKHTDWLSLVSNGVWENEG